jgi:hypothetical protein
MHLLEHVHDNVGAAAVGLPAEANGLRYVEAAEASIQQRRHLKDTHSLHIVNPETTTACLGRL